MYLEKLPDNLLTTTLVKIKYDCCGKEHTLKWKDANKNFQKNGGKHLCHPCWLKTNNPAKTDAAKEKMKKTNLERYGATTAMNTPENIEKRKENFKNEEFVKARNENRKATCVERYGVEHQMQIPEVKAKVKETNQERYGGNAPIQNPEILAKVQATNLERYGDVCSLNSPEVKAKAIKTMIENHGVEFYNQLPEMKDYLRENCREWLKESWENPWAKGVPKTDEQKQKQRETVAELVAAGDWHTGDKNSIKGRYFSKKCINQTNPIFRSSYELIVHIWCDNNPDIESYEYEPYLIEYADTEGKIRYYFPDFLIKFLAKPKLLLLEVKNDYAMKFKINENKNEAAILHAAENNLEYELWSNDKIAQLNIDYKNFANQYEVWSKNN